MKGYLNRPEATAAMIDADGWLHTGDIGYADEDGCFYVVDRLKELIKYKGMQIAPGRARGGPADAHPAVADAAVIPIADEEAGEVPKAFVVLNGEATPEEILAFVAARVAPYKKIRAPRSSSTQIPKSPSGKILRRVLIERERARGDARRALDQVSNALLDEPVHVVEQFWQPLRRQACCVRSVQGPTRQSPRERRLMLPRRPRSCFLSSEPAPAG